MKGKERKGRAKRASRMVEAAGIEPASMVFRKERWRATSDDSRRQSVAKSRFRVPWSPLKSPGVHPSLGDILETDARVSSHRGTSSSAGADAAGIWGGE